MKSSADVRVVKEGKNRSSLLAILLMCGVIALGSFAMSGCSSGPDVEITKKDRDNVKNLMSFALNASGAGGVIDSDCLMDEIEDLLGKDGYKCLVWAVNMEMGNKYTPEQRQEIKEFCTKVGAKLDQGSLTKLGAQAAAQCLK